MRRLIINSRPLNGCEAGAKYHEFGLEVNDPPLDSGLRMNNAGLAKDITRIGSVTIDATSWLSLNVTASRPRR